MDDAWELANFQNLDRDGSGDFDGDGATDLQEFLAGTNPTDPASFLRIRVTGQTSSSCTLGFSVVTGKTYAVVYRDAVAAGPWLSLTNLPAQPANGPVQVTDSNIASSSRFYRVVTPAP